MNSNGHEIMVALVILATRGPLRRSEGRAQTVLYRKTRRLSSMVSFNEWATPAERRKDPCGNPRYQQKRAYSHREHD
jgi:hypothetical protein